jgi:hypothetical protein
MADFASMRTTDIWYAMLDADKYIKVADEAGLKGKAKEISDKAQTKDSLHALDKHAEDVDGEYRIKSEPPYLVPLREFRGKLDLKGHDLETLTNKAFKIYQQSLADDTKWLLDSFSPKDIAIKVVGVGSVGTVCMILMLEGRDREDPLFLQLKEAKRSVLEEYLAPSPYQNQGQRVVEGQRLMQTVSDIFLGWTRGHITGKDFYWRQLRDWKGAADVENMKMPNLLYLARLCGWTLARAHARSGDPVAIAGYLGTSDTFDRALTEFAERYADQNERDYEAFLNLIRSGRLEAAPEPS